MGIIVLVNVIFMLNQPWLSVRLFIYFFAGKADEMDRPVILDIFLFRKWHF